ncbi:uncharacterized protein IUM83_04173 [Phytophthora cinnamomi]|uniref:uncharacterized protein n=1 Tax=Phytophthora cinnamomi TaxID=4785 RepID=UPI00355954C9|nr:hypothetical protein IUM83_04173 [Phytophthora cinnamomi]
MDVPSWHPANQNADALRRLAMSGGAPAKRSEFTVMAGSDVDASTEAERQLVAREESAVRLGGGRGLLDPSDRLYLVEQRELEQAAKGREQQEREAALQAFRSNALRAHKAAVAPEIAAVAAAGGHSKLLSAEAKPVVVIKAKKRAAAAATEKEKKDAKAKKAKATAKKSLGSSAGPRDKANRKGRASAKIDEGGEGGKKGGTPSKTNAATKSLASALWLADYSSSSDDE